MLDIQVSMLEGFEALHVVKVGAELRKGAEGEMKLGVRVEHFLPSPVARFRLWPLFKRTLLQRERHPIDMTLSL